MAIAFVAATANNSGGSVTTTTSTKPTGVVAGHVLVASVSWFSSAQTVTPPSGWVAADVMHQSPVGTVRSQLFTKVATGSEPSSYTWTFSGAVYGTTSVAAYSGVNNTNPVGATTFQGYGTGSGQVTSAALTVTQAGQLAVYCIGDSNNTTHSWTMGHNERTDLFSNGFMSTGLADGGPFGQGSLGGATTNGFTPSAGSSNGGMITTLLLNPDTVSLTDSDAGAGAEKSPATTVSLLSIDSGFAADAYRQTAMSYQDAAAGSERPAAIAASFLRTDSGFAADAWNGTSATFSRTDTGVGTDTGARAMSNIVDDFSETSLLTDWNDSFGVTLDTIANRVKLPCNKPGTARLASKPVSMYESSFFAKVTPPPTGNGSTYMGIYFTLDGSNYASYVINGGILNATVTTAGVTTTTAIGPYAPEAHRWLKVVDHNGVLTFQSSPNGFAWTTETTIPIGFLRGEVSVAFITAYTGTEVAGLAGYVEYVNSPPPPPPLGPSIFQVMVELSLSAPFDANPIWQDITDYVDCVAGIKLGRGRTDIFSTVEAYDCSFKVSNLDGRFTRTNPASPYYPSLRINNRIRVSVIYLGVTYTRYVGYVNEWPNKWEGEDAYAEVTCSDVFKVIEQQSNSRGNYIEEALADKPVALYPLDEESPATTFGCMNLDVANVNAPSALRLVRMSQAQVTGDDPNKKQDFAQIEYRDSAGAPDAGGGVKFTSLPGLHAGGYILRGNLPTAMPTDWAIEFWMIAPGGVSNNVTDNDDYSCMINLNAKTRLTSSLNIAVDAGPSDSLGNIMLAQEKGSSAAFTRKTTRVTDRRAYIADGNLHMITVEYTSSTHTTAVYVDGIRVINTTNHTWPSGMRLLTVGGKDDREIVSSGALNLTKVDETTLELRLSTFSGTLSNVAIFNKAASTYGTPASRYQGGQGWNNEYSGARIKRLLALVGLPSSMYAAVANGTQLVGSQFTLDSSLLDAARASASVEDMPLYVNHNGVMAFDDRTVRDSTTFSPQITISAVEFQDVSFADDDAFIVNTVDVSGTYIGKQTLANLDGGTSIQNFGEYRKSLDNLPVFTDSQVFYLARKLLNGFANPSPRLEAIVLQNAAVLDPAVYITILGLDVNSGIALLDLDTTYPEHNLPSPYNSYAEGIEEVISANCHQFTFNSTAVVPNDPDFANSGDAGVWQLGVTGRNELGTNTVLDY